MKKGIFLSSPRNKRRAYLLFEVMIAFSLAALALSFLIYPHFFCIKEELKEACALELERASDLIFLTALQQLACNEKPYVGEELSFTLGEIKKTYPLQMKVTIPSFETLSLARVDLNIGNELSTSYQFMLEKIQ